MPEWTEGEELSGGDAAKDRLLPTLQTVSGRSSMDNDPSLPRDRAVVFPHSKLHSLVGECASQVSRF